MNNINTKSFERKNTNFGSLCVFLLLLSYSLGVRLEVANIVIDLGLLTVFIVLATLFLSPKNFSTSIPIVYLLIPLAVLFLGIYSALIYSFNTYTTEGFLFLRITINNLVYITFSAALSIILIRRGYEVNDLMRFVFAVSALNALIILTTFLIPEARVFLESFLYQMPNSNIDYANVDWRLRGIASSGGASLSVFMGFSILAGVLAVEAKKMPVYVFLLSSGMILISLIVIARTGLIFGVLIIASWLFVQFINFRVSRIFVLLCCLGISLGFFFSYIEYFQRVLPWAFELFINVFSGQGASTASTDDLISMLVIPNDPLRVFLGFGFFESNVDFRSDSGYLKTIFSVGIPFTVSLYFFYAYIFLKFVPKGLSVGRCYWILVLSIFFILEIKEPFFYQNYSARILVLVAVFVAFQNRYRRLGASSTCHRRS